MRDDTLARQSRMIWAIKASLNGLGVAGVARPDRVKESVREKGPSKACSKIGMGFFVLGNRWRYSDRQEA
jgi:hypothetical protein